MKIEAVNRVIETKDGRYSPGQPFEAEAKEAEWLIKNGYAKKAGDTPAQEAKPEQKQGGAK
jgi:hypothetical protein